MLTKRFFIDSQDFKNVDERNFFGLAPNQEKAVGLKYGPNVYYQSHEVNAETGEVDNVRVTLDTEKTVRPKTHIHWLSELHSNPAEFRLYDPLLVDDRAAVEADFLKYINPKSESIIHGRVEKSIVSLPTFNTVQFERVGYFTVDVDATEKHPVLNRVISLKEDAKVSMLRKE